MKSISPGSTWTHKTQGKVVVIEVHRNGYVKVECLDNAGGFLLTHVNQLK